MDNLGKGQLGEQAKTYSIYELKLRFSSIINYTYIIVDRYSKEAAIVDPAWELKPIYAKLYMLGVRPTTILLTHSHFDHVNLVEPLIQIYNSQVYMSMEEIEFYNYRCQNLKPVYHLDVIKLGRTKISVLLTPGHTAGSTCFLLANSLFTGDTIFIEGCGICNTKGGAEQMFNSIQMIKKMVAPEVRVYPGHSFGKKPGYPLRYLMEQNIYFQLDRQEMFSDFRMRKHQNNLFNFK